MIEPGIRNGSGERLNNGHESDGPAKAPATAKRDALMALAATAQQRWASERIFQQDAPAQLAGMAGGGGGKFMATIPYPYMNGRLHLGHAFTLSKAEFAATYQRLQGKHVLFPFGFHGTGMPIKACADKLRREMEEFGNPPRFPEEEHEEHEEEKEKKEKHTDKDDNMTVAGGVHVAASNKSNGSAHSAHSNSGNGFHGKKAKATAKAGAAGARQWQIMRQLGVAEGEIARFADAHHWLAHFPAQAREDLCAFGAGIDWRRAFVTTDANPYYDGFVRWQFETLRKLGKLFYGKRYTIWSPLDGQPCLDHERAVGEGVLPRELLALKLAVPDGSLPARLRGALRAGQRVSLLAGTLRPETLYGITNVWLAPEAHYIAWSSADGAEVFISTPRAARNMAFQGRTPEAGRVAQLGERFTGAELLGMRVLVPRTVGADAGGFAAVYTLPSTALDAAQGTGVVASVPAEVPSDYIAMRDLLGDNNNNTYSGVDVERMARPFLWRAVLSTREHGSGTAQRLVETMRIKSQREREALGRADESALRASMASGSVLLVGPHAGEVVKEARVRLSEALVAAGEALLFGEPGGAVTSRSGDECVVCLTDQWYIDYGEAAWRERTVAALSGVELFSEEARAQMRAALDWLSQWACSRTYGLGTRLPWDPQYVIESLSDSTIYMAYYAVAHLLHADIYGAQPGELGIAPAQMTGAVWDMVLLGAPHDPACGVAADKVARMRREFDYWLPFDLRVTGKELIANHLSFCLYTHTAIFPPDKWPRGMRANGHVLLNGQPMSKSKGNFLTLREACERYSPDAVRFALADAGDGLDDANFAETVADGAVLRLHGFVEWVRAALHGGGGASGASLASMRPAQQAPSLLADDIFSAEIDHAIVATARACDAMAFRAALQAGFYQLQAARERYLAACSAAGATLHAGVVRRFASVQTQLLCIFCPHTADHVWRELLGNDGSVLGARYPAPELPEARRESLLASAAYLERVLRTARAKLARKLSRAGDGGGSKQLTVAFRVAGRAPAWFDKAVQVLREAYRANRGRLPDGSIGALFKQHADLQPHLKRIVLVATVLTDAARTLGDAAFVPRMPFSELQLLRTFAHYIQAQLQVAAVQVAEDGDKTEAVAGAETARVFPGSPACSFLCA